jgi:integrase/recombinase XerC
MITALNEFLDAMRYSRGHAPSTLDAYRNDLRACIQTLTSLKVKRLEDVTSDHLITHLNLLQQRGFSPRSLLRNTAAIKSFFTWLLDEELIPINPTDVFPTGKRPQELPRTIEEKTLGRLIDAITGEEANDIRDRAVLELLYGCGLRCAELCALSLHDIDFKLQRLRVCGKGRRERVIPFGTPAKTALERYLSWRTSHAEALEKSKRARQLFTPVAPFFLTPKGKHFRREILSKIVRERIRQHLPEGTTHVTPHVLRHAFATHLLDHDAPLLDIRDLLGHASVATTQIYTHVSDTKLKKTFKDFFPRA